MPSLHVYRKTSEGRQHFLLKQLLTMLQYNYTCSRLRFGRMLTLLSIKNLLLYAANGWGATFESAAFKLKPQPSKVCFESCSTQTQTSNFVEAYVARNTKTDLKNRFKKHEKSEKLIRVKYEKQQDSACCSNFNLNGNAILLQLQLFPKNITLCIYVLPCNSCVDL